MTMAEKSWSNGSGGAVGIETVDRRAAGSARTSVLPVGRATDSGTTRDALGEAEVHGKSARFAVPATVLLAALAIFEGYRWLHLIPDGSLRPTAVLFLAGVVPATVHLTHRIDCPLGAPLRRGACGLAALVLVLGVVALAAPELLFLQAVGCLTLALAAVLVVQAVAAESHARRSGTN